MENNNLELLVPLALFGFTLYLSFAFTPGNILYFVSGRLWLWLRRQQRREASFRRNAREIAKDLDLFRNAVVPGEEGVEANVRKMLQKKGAETGYFRETLTAIAQNRADRRGNQAQQYAKALQVWTEDEFTTVPENQKKTSKFVCLDPGAKRAQTERLEAVYRKASIVVRKEKRSTMFREYLLAPLIDCPVCMLFWYSIPAFAIMSLAAGFAWENYPTHLFAAFALMMLWKSWRE